MLLRSLFYCVVWLNENGGYVSFLLSFRERDSGACSVKKILDFS